MGIPMYFHLGALEASFLCAGVATRPGSTRRAIASRQAMTDRRSEVSTGSTKNRHSPNCHYSHSVHSTPSDRIYCLFSRWARLTLIIGVYVII